MKPGLVRLISLIVTMLLSHPAIGCSQVTLAVWLDEPKPASWNTPGRPIPTAPQVEGTMDPRCRHLARPPERKEDRASSGRSSVSSSPGLAGTSWQLVTFRGGDDTTLTPDDRAKYTIQFAAAGRFFTRVDCNRGQGTWKSSGLNQIEFGPLALTRAQCPPGSLHDQIVKQWGNIRSYVIRDGHLFLALIADGGIYEFEPMSQP
jgi:heat shock protein HslJ